MTTTVAGVPFQDLWCWRCPKCTTRIVRGDERQLAECARSHYEHRHAPLNDQLELNLAGAG